MSTRTDALLRLNGILATSLGLWAAEEPDLDALAALAVQADAVAAGLAALPAAPGDGALAADAERLRAELAAISAERLAEARGAWAGERRALEAVRGAYAGPARPPQARFLDRRQ